jgi:hypothetical protein
MKIRSVLLHILKEFFLVVVPEIEIKLICVQETHNTLGMSHELDHKRLWLHCTCLPTGSFAQKSQG